MVTDATIANDRARLLQARQQLESAEADLAAATLTSPTYGRNHDPHPQRVYPRYPRPAGL